MFSSLRSENYIQSIINMAKVLQLEHVLLVDQHDTLIKKYDDLKMNVDIVYCHPSDFSVITKHSDSYLNRFDVVICPNALYDNSIISRLGGIQNVLKCMVFAMKETSRFIFSVPNIKFFIFDTKFEYMNHNFILKDKGKQLEISKKDNWYDSLRKRKENWYAPAIKYCTQFLNVWNSENPLCQWDTENIAIYQLEGYSFYSVDMKKNLRVKLEE